MDEFDISIKLVLINLKNSDIVMETMTMCRACLHKIGFGFNVSVCL